MACFIFKKYDVTVMLCILVSPYSVFIDTSYAKDGLLNINNSSPLTCIKFTEPPCDDARLVCIPAQHTFFSSSLCVQYMFSHPMVGTGQFDFHHFILQYTISCMVLYDTIASDYVSKLSWWLELSQPESVIVHHSRGCALRVNVNISPVAKRSCTKQAVMSFP